MLTRCPACETTFRVHSEQLKVRQGKVRCGECQAVFNALDSLIEEFVLKPPGEPADAAIGALAEHESEYVFANEPVAAPPAEFIPDELAVPQELTFPEAVPVETIIDAPVVSEIDEGSSEEMASVSVAVESDGTEVFDADPAYPITPELSTEVFPADESASISGPTLVEERAPADEPVDELPPEPTPEPLAVSAEPEASDAFEPALHVAPAARSAWPVWLWASGIVLAIVILLLQTLLHFRVEIATVSPATRPIFVSVCELFGCTVELPRKIEQLSIEASDLHPDPAYPGRAGRLGLQISLRNRAPFAQTWPHIELTLTDTNDQVVVRRMLTAEDYLISKSPTPALIAQGIAAKQDVTLELAIDVGDLPASGYRLYLFYP